MSQAHPTITDQAAALLADAERALADGDARLRSMGLDPDKVRTLGQDLTAAQRRELDAALQADLDAIDQSVAEEKARQSVNRPTAAVTRRPQRFV